MKQMKLFNRIVIALHVLFLACGGSQYTAEKSNINVSHAGYTASSSVDKSPSADLDDRKVIYDANIKLKVKDVDTVNNQLGIIAKRYEGYVQSTSSTYSVIRVKATLLDKAMGDISELGKVESKGLSTEDVTDNYADYSIRLENLEKTRKRYLELLDKAENVEEILKVEKELERVNQEIDVLKGRLNRYDHLLAFSTIRVGLQEKVKPGILGYVFKGLYHGVKWLFVRG